MNTRIVAMVGVLLCGCPFQERPDGGPVDSGDDGTASCSAVPLPFAPVYGVVDEAMTVVVPDGPRKNCTASATLRSPAGDEQAVPVSVTTPTGSGASSAELSVTPTSAGEWSVHLVWSGPGGTGEQLLKFPVFEKALTGPVIRQDFVDRMDLCVEGVQRTKSGLVLCVRGEETWVYSSTGAILTHFTGVGLRVFGDEVWTLVGSDVQHRTDVGGSLRFDATLTIDLSRGKATELESGKYVRTTPDGLVVVRWDGSTLTAQETRNVPGAEFLEATGDAWTLGGCSVRQGCQQSTCPPIIICPEAFPFFTTLVTPDALWGIVSQYSNDFVQPNFRMIKRPLTSPGMPSKGISRDVMVPRVAGTDVPFGFVAPTQVPYFDTGRHVLIARRDGDAIAFSAVPSAGRVINVSRDWIISISADPLSVSFTPMP